MNYGQAIEAMKRGDIVIRVSDSSVAVALAAAGTPQQYFQKSTPDGMSPYVPSVEDQLATDWGIIG